MPTFHSKPSPALFEACPEVVSCSVRYEAPHEVTCQRVEFAAGRHCAMEALHLLGCPVDLLPIGNDRLPVWPLTIVGSITHTHGFASAAVAPRTRFLGIGIDSERLLTRHEAAQLQGLVYGVEERECCQQAALSEHVFPTVIFSAKETLFKCLYPLTRVFLDFQDVRLVAANQETVTLRVRDGISPLAFGGRSFAVRYVVDDGFVHSGLDLPRF